MDKPEKNEVTVPLTAVGPHNKIVEVGTATIDLDILRDKAKIDEDAKALLEVVGTVWKFGPQVPKE